MSHGSPNVLVLGGLALAGWYLYHKNSSAISPVHPVTGSAPPAGYAFRYNPATRQYQLVRIGSTLSGYGAPVTPTSTTFPPPAAPNGYYYQMNPLTRAYQLQVNPLGAGTGVQQSLITAIGSGAGGLLSSLFRGNTFNNLFNPGPGTSNDVGVIHPGASNSAYTGESASGSYSGGYIPSDGVLPDNSTPAGIAPLLGANMGLRTDSGSYAATAGIAPLSSGGLDTLAPIGELLPVNNDNMGNILDLPPGGYAAGTGSGSYPGSYAMNSLGAVSLSGNYDYQDLQTYSGNYSGFSAGGLTGSGYY